MPSLFQKYHLFEGYAIILTYSMVQSPSWEANWFAASQEIPRISRNPKVHHRTHKHPSPFSILDQPNPVHILTSHLLEIRPNIIHPSTSRSPHWAPSLRFPHQDPIHPLSSPIASLSWRMLFQKFNFVRRLAFHTYVFSKVSFRSKASLSCRCSSKRFSSFKAYPIISNFSRFIVMETGVQRLWLYSNIAK